MILKRTIGLTTLMLAAGSFSVQAAYPIWHDTTATAVVINKKSCFIGIIRNGYYKMDGLKHKAMYYYIHLLHPINVFPASTTGDLWYIDPEGHQYDFGLVFNTSKMLYYTEKFINETVEVLGSVASPPTGFHAPTFVAMKILQIKVLRSSGMYKSVCHFKPPIRYKLIR